MKQIHNPKAKDVKNILISFLFILVIGQSVMIFMITKDIMSLNYTFNATTKEIYNKINTNNANVQSKINQLTGEIVELNSNITNIEEGFDLEINKLKAGVSSDFSGIVENSIDSVVTIKTNAGQGTGFIITSDGYVVTNAHVLSYARYANAITADQQNKQMSLIGYDDTFDIALLKISGDYEFLELGDSDKVKTGEKVIAIGNPLGLEFSVSEGIVSAIDRTSTNNIPAYIQTDAALNPGNSGGPLINSEGKVIGINNFKVGGSESLGFALESNYVKSTVNQIALENLNQTIV